MKKRAPGKPFRFRGTSKTLCDWAAHLGITEGAFRCRIRVLMRRDGASRDEAIFSILDNSSPQSEGIEVADDRPRGCLDSLTIS